MTPSTQRCEILERRVFERLLFAQCWEDPALDRASLEVGSRDTVLSVTSGGCNTLSLAVLEPARIIAVDLNATQNYLLELKIAGARRLDHGEYLEILGVRPSARRGELYRALRDDLSRDARAYWDAAQGAIASGVLRSGRYERYLEAFRRLINGIQGRRTVARLFEATSLAEQRRFYEQSWNTRAWRLLFRVFFSRPVLGLKGLDPRFFTYVDGVKSFGEHFRSLARHALVDLPIRDNYFVAQICLGRYLDERHVPPYLQARNFAALRRSVDRIEIRTGELGAILANLDSDSVDCFNFSNVFEWVSEQTFRRMLREVHRVARHGARLCYRNLLVRRRHPAALDSLFTPNDELASRLLQRDRSFVYSHFEVASVRKAAALRRPA
jgi:S-adenosylmethionine-diacylglycerol 3-amino-3-carboxypropyl transferase